ncbi:MAG: sulfotransferase family 2 domain-containing protein [bacterium]
MNESAPPESSPVILYLHVPKAAGTTLSDWMFDQVRRGATNTDVANLHAGVFYYPAGFVVEPSAEERAHAQRVMAREDLRAVFGHFHFGVHRQLVRPWTYVTMLRHPVDRVLSLYSFQRLMEHKTGAHHGVRLLEDIDIRAFVADPPYAEVDNGQTRRIAGAAPSVGRCTSEVLDIAKRNLQRAFAVVGVTERFDETLILLCKCFGWSSQLLYYPTNVNTTRSDQSAPDDVVAQIEKTQWLDMALYDHVQKLMDKQIDRYGPAFTDDLKDFKSRKHAWYETVGKWDMPSRLW